jgi:hypothetical protein
MGRMATRHSILRVLATLGLLGSAAFVTLAPAAPAAATADGDWLGIVNTYRAMSGLGPLGENAAWSAEDAAHSCYMLYNGISHDEIPGRTGYTPGGDVAGNSGNVAVSSSVSATARNHVDLWMTGPFHAIGVLRHNLTTTGFGMCTNSGTSPWKSAATLDVLRGIDSSRPRPSTPIVFPGRGATIPLTRFVTESPDPMALCGWTGGAGLPLIAMMPAAVTSATATLTGPGGPVETCALHGGNTGGNSTAQSILRSENAIIVMPRSALQTGTYTATVTSNGGSTSWSFNVDPGASLSQQTVEVPVAAPATVVTRFEPVAPNRYADSRFQHRLVRLRANQPRQLVMADPGTDAVSANFTIANQDGAGYLTVYNCTQNVPLASTLNYDRMPVPNQAVVPLMQGTLCLNSTADADIVIDVNGYFRGGGSTGFVPVDPGRVADTRTSHGPRLAAGEVREFRVEDVPGGVPSSAVAVAFNVTAVGPDEAGYVQAYPCDQPQSAEISTVNFTKWEVRPNSTLLRTSSAGTICVRTTTSVDIIVDVFGYFAPGKGYGYTGLTPTRILDTRTANADLNPVTGGAPLGAGQTVALQVAGRRGVPGNAKAVSINLTGTGTSADGWVAVFPCGGLPPVSNLNTTIFQTAIANGAMVALDGSGRLCVYSDSQSHLIIDISGVWS